jgi:hypothetical protein
VVWTVTMRAIGGKLFFAVGIGMLGLLPAGSGHFAFWIYLYDLLFIFHISYLY